MPSTKLTKGPWSNQELRFVIDNYGRLQTKEIAKRLNRAYGGVAYQITELRKQGLIGYELNDRKQIVETTTVLPEVEEPRKPWWKFW